MSVRIHLVELKDDALKPLVYDRQSFHKMKAVFPLSDPHLSLQFAADTCFINPHTFVFVFILFYLFF